MSVNDIWGSLDYESGCVAGDTRPSLWLTSPASATVISPAAQMAGPSITPTSTMMPGGSCTKLAAVICLPLPIVAGFVRVASECVRQRLQFLGRACSLDRVLQQLFRGLTVHGLVQVVFGSKNDAFDVDAGKQSSAA